MVIKTRQWVAPISFNPVNERLWSYFSTNLQGDLEMTSREIYENNKEELIKRRMNGELIKNLGIEYGIPKGSLIKYFEDDNIILTPHYKTENYKKEVVDLYNQGYHFYQIAKMVHSNHKVVKRTLIEQGVNLRTVAENHRKWELDEHYFDCIDTPNKAYILGFLYADGFNSLDKHSVRIALQEEDKDILEEMRMELKSSKPLTYLDFKGEIRSNGFTCKNMYQLEVYGNHICKRLDEIGMHQNKSLILQYPSIISEQLHSHFIRGYFDGDGSISLSRKNGKISSSSITITSTENFCKSIYDILSNYLDIRKVSIRDASCHNGITRVIGISNKYVCLDFCNWIYKDADMYLKRKYNKYIELKEYLSNLDNK